MKIKLLKMYQESKIGDIINVDKDVASYLINKKVAKHATLIDITRNVLVEPTILNKIIHK